jgi:Membrane dipeptidase (Peptidase family M19)
VRWAIERASIVGPGALRIEVLFAIAKKNGVVGLWALSNDVGKTAQSYAERLTELTGWLGDDHVGFGTDMNGLATNALIKSYVDLRQVLDHLQSRGMPERRIHKLAIGNYARVLRRALQGSEARSLAIARRSRRGATVIGRHVDTGPITKPSIFSVRVFRGGFS